MWMNPCWLPRLWAHSLSRLILLAQADFLHGSVLFACLATYDRRRILPHLSVPLIADWPLVSFFTLYSEPFYFFKQLWDTVSGEIFSLWLFSILILLVIRQVACLFFFKVAFLGQRSQTKISCVQPQLQLLQTAINMLQALITDSGDNFNKKFRKHKNIKRSLMKYKVALRNKIEKNS